MIPTPSAPARRQHAQRLQGVRRSRQRGGPRGGHRHGRELRRHRHLARQRHPDAPHRATPRSGGLHELLREPIGPVVPDARRREGGRRADAQLRRVPQHRDQLPHRLVRDVRGDPSGEPPLLQAGVGGAGNEGVSVLRDHDSHAGAALPPLHVGPRGGALGPSLNAGPRAQSRSAEPVGARRGAQDRLASGLERHERDREGGGHRARIRSQRPYSRAASMNHLTQSGLARGGSSHEVESTKRERWPTVSIHRRTSASISARVARSKMVTSTLPIATTPRWLPRVTSLSSWSTLRAGSDCWSRSIVIATKPTSTRSSWIWCVVPQIWTVVPTFFALKWSTRSLW